MIKVNLEKELVKQNKSLVSARELLLIREYERTADIAEDKIIKRVFGELPASEGGKIKKNNERLLTETKKFNQEKVFHISQIKKLCKKYHLRFLPSILFKGSIDRELPSKISQFEIAYGVDCKEWVVQQHGYSIFDRGTIYENGNTYIAAPAKSFSLQEKPRDPLVFFKINEDYYYLIHKWGNDINIFRTLLRFLSGWLTPIILLSIPALSIGILLIIKYHSVGKDIKGIGEALGLIMIIASSAFLICQFVLQEDGLHFVKNNNWRSQFID